MPSIVIPEHLGHILYLDPYDSTLVQLQPGGTEVAEDMEEQESGSSWQYLVDYFPLIYAWLKDLPYMIEIDRWYTHVSGNRIPCTWYVGTDLQSQEEPIGKQRMFEDTICSLCHSVSPIGTLVCPDCFQIMLCPTCHRVGDRILVMEINSLTSQIGCSQCVVWCTNPDCTNAVCCNRPDYGRTGEALCSDCREGKGLEYCAVCRQFTDTCIAVEIERPYLRSTRNGVGRVVVGTRNSREASEFGHEPGDPSEEDSEPPFIIYTQAAATGEPIYSQPTLASPPIAIESTIQVCPKCAPDICSCCGSPRSATRALKNAKKSALCNTCYQRYYAPMAKLIEATPIGIKSVQEMILPTMENRQSRNLGIELEGNGNGDALAKALYAQKLTGLQNVGTHGANSQGIGAFPCHVEYDTTVDWELVIRRFSPANLRALEKVGAILDTVNALRQKDIIQFNLNCGLHIHVHAKQMGTEHLYALWQLFAICEDPIFRLAASKWPIHRALKGRDGIRIGTIGDNHTADPIPKGDWKNRIEFGQRYLDGVGTDRYYALNVQPYWRAIHSCTCGATMYGSLTDCTCPLKKPTVEFRVFNATSDYIKIHGYMALCQALVAKAVELGENAAKLPLSIMDFTGKMFKDCNAAEKQYLLENWEPRIDYIFNQLPLTAGEKESLLYIMESSDLSHSNPAALVGVRR